MLTERNQAIIDAVIEKAERRFPGSLALIGVYGSFLTGDIHEKSDLDLMIVINDDCGWQLGCTFIQDDLNVGHDIYCTSWSSLENDAEYTHPHISKLMDSRIVYCADEKYLLRLNALRAAARKKLDTPLSESDIANARSQLSEAEHAFACAMIAQNLSDMRNHAGNMVYYLENAVALLSKCYFRFGTRRIYDELRSMSRCPKDFCGLIDAVVSAETKLALREALTALMTAAQEMFASAENDAKSAFDRNMDISGTYEEMFSNWRNKMHLAAELNDRHLAFMCMGSLQAMLDDIYAEHDIARYDVFAGYEPVDLAAAAAAFDRILDEYLSEYKKAGIAVKHYPDIYEFVRGYGNE